MSMFYRKANPALMRQDIAAVVGRSAANCDRRRYQRWM